MPTASKIIIILSSIFILNFSANAQFWKKKQSTPTPKIEKTEPKTIAEITKKCKKTEGLFTIYQDTTNGAAYLLLKQEQLNKEFIYFSYIADGIVATGHFRGNFKASKIVRIKKYFNKIEFVEENTAFYFDTLNALSKAAEANISKATLLSLVIVAEDKASKSTLIKADDIFLTENLEQVKPNPTPIPSFTLGSLSKEKTKYISIKSYPLNTDVVVEYVYDNPAPTTSSGSDAADDRFISIKVQHSFIEVPKNNFKPRYEDPRIGYFTKQVEDMTSTSATPYKDVISRWNLEKKDKNAPLSEPIEPITWWLENTTPIEYRAIITKAALSWNTAFEPAGFKNAIVVKTQSDSADWEAGDIRYNVLRWTSSPKPKFGGYGPSFVNPRTGQILGADIMFEYIFITNKLKQEKLFSELGINLFETPTENNYCSISECLQQTNLFSMAQLSVNDANENEKKNYLESSIYYLVLHEMGHTMGLQHNMKASQLYSPAEINNTLLTSKTGLIASVMDYPIANIALDKTKQGEYFTTKPGPYDLWAIAFGYTPELDNPTAESERKEKLLARSTEPALMFGNDADDMRSSGKGIDPRINVNDMSNDAITYSINRIKLAETLIKNLKEKYTAKNQSYQELRNSYLTITTEINNAAIVISRYVAGVYVDRSFVGQITANKPFVPVSYADQKRAMDAISKNIFAANALAAPTDLYNYLQVQRRGYTFFEKNEDPKIHDRVLNIQKTVFDHILHPDVLKRVTDSELYGNKYALPELMNDVTNAVFKEDLLSHVNSFRQNLQLEYINRLLLIIVDKTMYDYRSKVLAMAELKTLIKTLNLNTGIDPETQAHRQYIVSKINKTLEEK